MGTSGWDKFKTRRKRLRAANAEETSYSARAGWKRPSSPVKLTSAGADALQGHLHRRLVPSPYRGSGLHPAVRPAGVGEQGSLDPPLQLLGAAGPGHRV